MVDNGLFCTVNTDDPSMFSTDLVNEYLTLAAQGFTLEELWNLNLNGLQSTFIDEGRKKKMSLFDCGTQWVERELVKYKELKSFIAVSNLTKEKFLEEYSNVDPDRVAVVHPGVDVNKFQRCDRKLCREEVRRRLGISPSEMVILFVSMNYDIKGLDHLIKGLGKFQSRHPGRKFRLLVVGKSNERKYVSLAAKLGIGDRVIYTGPVKNAEITRMYLASDAFSILSRFDTFGLAVLEAMAASLPVMISSNVGARDLIRSGENGFVTRNEKDPGEIADVLSLLSCNEIRDELSLKAFQTAVKYSWDVAAEKTKDIYDNYLNTAASAFSTACCG